jgi:hypothetical protein
MTEYRNIFIDFDLLKKNVWYTYFLQNVFETIYT